MTKAEFLNRVRSLFNIDPHLLPELTTEQQAEFIREPVRYFIQADKAQSDAIWREVERRQDIPKPAIECERFSADATAQDDGLVQVRLWRTTDPGPLLEFKPDREFLLDHPHALELLGSLSIALQKVNPRPKADT